MKVVRAILELELDEDVRGRVEDVSSVPSFNVRDTAGGIIGSSQLIGVEFPMPNIVRIEFDPHDIAWGLPE